jgi:exodeoxyribonuclease VII small subunit
MTKGGRQDRHEHETHAPAAIAGAGPARIHSGAKTTNRTAGERMADTASPPDIQSMSFENALEELETIVRQLEAGRGKLDEAIGAYERGAALKRHCETKLTEAKAKIERIAFAADGTLKTETRDSD